jgi:hypothetical protein
VVDHGLHVLQSHHLSDLSHALHVPAGLHHTLDAAAHSASLGPALLTVLTLGALWEGSGLVARVAAPASQGAVALVAADKSAAEYRRPFDYVVAPLRRLSGSEVVRIVVTLPSPNR